MPTKHSDKPDNVQTYAMVDLPRNIVLPMEDAIEVFRMLGRATYVEYDWQSKVHKRCGSNVEACLKSFTLAQMAELELNSD